MSRKTHDVCIAIGEYTDARGEKKKRYLNIGTMMAGDNGSFLLLDAHVLSMQVFALANKERKDSVLVSLFDANRERGASQEPPPYDDIPY